MARRLQDHWASRADSLAPGEKTRLIQFGRYAGERRRRKGKPETFTLLGFTHTFATSRDGRF